MDPSRRPTWLVLPCCLIACATDGAHDDHDERCAQAAAQLEECASGVAGDFLAACRESPGDDTDEIVDQILASDCDGGEAARSVDGSGGKEDGFLEAAFATACSPVIGAALVINRARGGAPVWMDWDTRWALRPFFGTLVDDVQIVWNASLTDKWSILGFNVQLGFDVAAQTFGNEVFVADGVHPGDLGQQLLLAHELTHSRQAAQRGGTGPFFEEYCRAYYRSGFDYTSNALEVEARDVAAGVSSCPVWGSGCP